MKKKFDVQGMTCSACSSSVEKNVNKLNGIKNVSVNLLTNSMMVDYDESKLNTNNIIAAVVDAGYNASTADQENIKVETKDELTEMKTRVLTSFIFLVPLLYLAMGHMLGWPLPAYFNDERNIIGFAFTQFLLLLPIVVVNRKYFQVGFKTLWKRSPNMDTLVALGSTAALAYGIFAIYMISYGLGYGDMSIIHKYSMDLYFESAGTILTLITLGKYFETKAKNKTSDAIKKLIELKPKTALVKRDEQEIEIPIDQVIVNDLVIVKPGMTIPVDGVVIEGRTAVDESAITGESLPVTKTVNDQVISATINKNGYILFRALKVGNDTTLAQIIRLVEEASASKAPIARLADKIAGIFVPVVISLSILTMIIWAFIEPDLAFVLSMGISVLIISCPCALGLATPVAIMVGTGLAAKEGILIKSSEALEKAHEIDTIVLDKTGTITYGKPEVVDIITYDGYAKQEMLKLVAAVEKQSEHPLAEAIVNRANEWNLILPKVEQLEVIVGKGITAQIDQKKIVIGNKTLFDELNIKLANAEADMDRLANEGKTPLYCGIADKLVGIIAIADQIKESSYQAISDLKKQHQVIMLTGDNQKTAQAIGDRLGFSKVIAEVLPDQKENVIIELQKEGHKVAMVGDGINDAVALTRADVGIAIGAGSDIAIESADIILMKNDLNDVVNMIKISDETVKNIKENLFWAFFYNLVGIPIAAGILYLPFGLKLSPMIAALAMSFSSVSVVTNALRLRLVKLKRKEEKSIMKKELMIEGMSCGHCVMHVEKALNAITGVHASVDLATKKAVVTMDQPVSDEVLKQAVSEAGYEVTEIK